MEFQRSILYISLLLVVFLLWQSWQEDYASDTSYSDQHDLNVEKSADTQGDVYASDKEQLPDVSYQKKQPIPSGEYIFVKTHKQVLNISLQGGSITYLALPT